MKKPPPASSSTVPGEALVPVVVRDDTLVAGGARHDEIPRETFERRARAVIAAKRTEGTRRVYAEQLQKWLTYADLADFDPAHATIAQVVDFRDQLAAHGLQGPTVANVLSSLSAIYDALHAQGAVPHNPFDAKAVGRPSSTPAQPASYVTDEDYERILAAAQAHPRYLVSCCWQAVIQLAWITGLRRTPLALLTVEAVRFDQRRQRYVVRALMKGEKQVEVPIRRAAVDVIEAYCWATCTTSGRLFPTLTGPAVYEILDTCAKRAGVTARIHPHGFRATLISNALDHVDPHEVAGLAGHASIQTTMKYDRKLRGSRAVDALDAADARKTAAAKAKKTNPKDDGGT